MALVAAGGSAAVRIDVPRLDTQQAASSQMDQIRAGLDAALRLLSWCEQDELQSLLTQLGARRRPRA